MIDLMEQLAVRRRGSRRARPTRPKSVDLPIVKRKSMHGEHHARRVVPAEERPRELKIEVMARCECRANRPVLRGRRCEFPRRSSELMAEGVIVYGVSQPDARFSSDIGG